MLTIASMIAAGPCLIALMAAVALWIVHRNLSQVRHALLWSTAFALVAVRWIYIGYARPGTPSMPSGGLGYSPLGMMAILLLAEGFRVRAGAKGTRWVIWTVAIVAIAVQFAALFLVGLPLRGAWIPFLGGLLVLWSTTLVVPRDRRSSVSEATVIGVLSLFAAVELGGGALAIAELGGLAPHGASATLFALTLQPVCAALAMSTLLLIAFDFSAEQRRLIHTDPLTGVLNRLGFEQAALAEMERWRQRTQPVSIALADLDSFKGVNDRYGHAVGDETLAGFARHLAGRLERGDAVGRFGGEEFALLLPGLDGSAAFARIEAIRRAFGDQPIEGRPELVMTASFGVAERQPGEALAQMIERADKALYESKRKGRNRTTLAPWSVD